MAVPSPKKNILNKTWKIIIGIGIVVSLVVGMFEVYDKLFKSDEEKFKEATSISGELKPPKINDNSYTPNTITTDEGMLVFLAATHPVFVDSQKNKKNKFVKGIHIKNINQKKVIWVEIGGNLLRLPPQYFKFGIDLFKTTNFNCTNTNLILGLKDNRLYISTEFKRLQNEETMGVIDFNHWTLYNENVLKYKENDTMLEVRDKQNKIAFSIKYGQTSIDSAGVIIRGYFIGDTSILVINSQAMMHNKAFELNNCIPKSDTNWKQKAQVLITDIKSLWK